MEGPVEVVLSDGTVARSDRFMVALCTCRRSRTYPWCDTSHRPRQKPAPSLGETARGAHDHGASRTASEDRSASGPQDRSER
ncbi:CDGSH iron-sulfur domain-containing protein [Streptomyces sp. NPDC055056]